MDKNNKHKTKKISAGHYIYRGYQVNRIGYYPPEQKVVWEAVDKNGCGFAHSFSFADTKLFIDELLDNNI